MTVENNVIHIDGLAFIKGMSASNLDKISISINTIDNLSKEVIKTYKTTVSESFSIFFSVNNLLLFPLKYSLPQFVNIYLLFLVSNL